MRPLSKLTKNVSHTPRSRPKSQGVAVLHRSYCIFLHPLAVCHSSSLSSPKQVQQYRAVAQSNFYQQSTTRNAAVGSQEMAVHRSSRDPEAAHNRRLQIAQAARLARGSRVAAAANFDSQGPYFAPTGSPQRAYSAKSNDDSSRQRRAQTFEVDMEQETENNGDIAPRDRRFSDQTGPRGEQHFAADSHSGEKERAATAGTTSSAESEFFNTQTSVPPRYWRVRRAAFLIYKWGFVLGWNLGPALCLYVYLEGGIGAWTDTGNVVGGGAGSHPSNNAPIGAGAVYGIRRHWAAFRGYDMPAPNPRSSVRGFTDS